MLKKQTLTEMELKSLLLARLKAQQAQQVKLQIRLNKALGSETPEEKPEITAIKNILMERMSDLLARRLKQDRRTTPLVSSRDFVQFVPYIIDEITKIEGKKFESAELKMLEEFVTPMTKNICRAIRLAISPRRNPYEEYWRWITTVLKLAAERNILPTELLAQEESADEINRRMFSKRQFIADSKRTTRKFLNADMLKSIILQPMMDVLGKEASEEERREFEQELEMELMPQLRDLVEKNKVAIESLLTEEVERIYKAA